MSNIEDIAGRREEWLKRHKLTNLPRVSSEPGQEIDVLYTPADAPQTDYLGNVGFPGEYPFTRGIYPGMYRSMPWLMRLYSGFGSAEDTNKRWKYLISKGANGVVCAFDLPTQLGLDSDHPMARAEVGKVGVAISSLRDFEILYDGLPLDKISTNMNIRASATTLLSMYVATAEKHGILSSELRGIVGTDVMCEFISRGAWIYPVRPTLRLATDIMEYCIKHLPHFHPIIVNGYVLREGGIDMAYEVGYALSIALIFVESALERGLDIDDVAPRISFFFGTGTEFLEEAAKFRATRRLWARLMKEKYGAKNPESMMMRFMSMVCGSYFRREEPENNLVRGAYGLLGAVLGGVQGAIHPAMDEAYAIPTEKTARLALRTQQICGYETGVMKTVDPLGGSYYIEALTDHWEKRIQQVLDEIERWGGTVNAIESGIMQRKVAELAFRRAKEEESGERVIVGVNKFPSEEQKREIEIHRVNPAVLQQQIERLKQVRAERDEGQVKKALKQLEEAAQDGVNTIPCTLNAVKAYATLGEIANILRSVFGEFKEPSGTF